MPTDPPPRHRAQSQHHAGPNIDQREHQELARAAKLLRENALDEARAIGEKIFKRNKRSVDALQLLGLIAFKQSQWNQAIGYYKKCIAIVSHTARFYYLLAKVHVARGDFDQAIVAFDQAIQIEPTDRQSIAWKAIALERQGKQEQAKGLLEPFIAAGTEEPEMAETYARIELASNRADAAVELIGRHLTRASLPELQRQVLQFLKARALEQAGDDNDATFHAYEDANRSLHAVFDRAAYEKYVDRLITAYSQEDFERIPRAKVTAEAVPVFIAGMPRSGTTLIEQIIDAHPDAHGAGEIKAMEEIERDLPQLMRSSKPYPECIDELKQKDIDQLTWHYLRAIGSLEASAKVVVNKSLENYKQVGLIALLVPHAKIIHCRRDPLDTCISCYFSHLMPPRFAYACDLENLGFVYKQYQRLMRHWQLIAPDQILEVRYEQLIADQEEMSRRIIKFCGLPWDDRCLRFHESGRVAMTLSYDQVRRPIYETSIGRAKRFERHLGGLKKSLGGAAEA